MINKELTTLSGGYDVLADVLPTDMYLHIKLVASLVASTRFASRIFPVSAVLHLDVYQLLGLLSLYYNGFSIISNSEVLMLGYRHFSMISRIVMLVCFLSIFIAVGKRNEQ